jgi:CDP-diacylglycerol--glycerol-3-phosphate 3-phosphatidyltransferase
MNIYSIKPKFQQALQPAFKQLVYWNIHPTTINLAAVFVSLLGGVLFYFSDQNTSLLYGIPILVFVRTALNALDGMVARALNVPHQAFGEVLNELCDRVSDTALFVGLALTSYTNTTLGFITLILILLNSYLSILSKAAGGSRQYGGVMGKADRMLYMGIFTLGIAVSKQLLWADILLWGISAGILLTFFSRFKQTKSELIQTNTRKDG